MIPKSPALSGRVVLITGVSREVGIGAAIARSLAADGAALFLASWAPHDAEQPWGASPEFADQLVSELREAGTREARWIVGQTLNSEGGFAR